jgi:hypothetical protein
LFDLGADPQERTNLLAVRRKDAVALNQKIVDRYPELAVTSWTVQQIAARAAGLSPSGGLDLRRTAFDYGTVVPAADR